MSLSGKLDGEYDVDNNDYSTSHCSVIRFNVPVRSIGWFTGFIPFPDFDAYSIGIVTGRHIKKEMYGISTIKITERYFLLKIKNKQQNRSSYVM